MPAVFDVLPLDADLFPSVVDVQRQTASGPDAAGFPAEVFATVYVGLSCLADPHPQGERDDFRQEALDLRYLVYFPPLNPSAPGLPDIRIRDRLVLGTWPSGATRYLDVVSVVDELDSGVILVVSATARKPG